MQRRIKDVNLIKVSDITGLPKVIHHTWRHVHLHPLLRRCVDSFCKWNPGWEYRFWTDEDCERLIGEEVPDFLKTYLGYPVGILRADIFRLAVLYSRGGVYADLDMECLRPLDDLLCAANRGDGSFEVYISRDHPCHEKLHYEGRAMWLNAFILAKPRARFLRLVLDELGRQLQTGNFDVSDAVMATGPGLLTRVVNLGKNDLAALGICEIPWQWVHPLPNVFLRFDERREYRRLVHRRWWREGVQISFDEQGHLNGEIVNGEPPFAAHYWWHSYIENCRQVNMLARYGSVLLQSDGEIVERRLGSLSAEECPQSLGEALCHLAERGGKRVLLNGAPPTLAMAQTLQAAGAGLNWQTAAMPGHDDDRADLLIHHATHEHHPDDLGNAANLLTPKGLLLCLVHGRDADKSAVKTPSGLRTLSGSFPLFEKTPGPESEIPKILHWLPWKNLNRWQYDAAQSWGGILPAGDWNWRKWTMESLTALVAENEPDLLPTFYDYPTDEHRLLAARWVVLKHLGGIIVSPDAVCLRPIHDLLHWKRLLFSTRLSPDGSRMVTENWLSSTPGHPFWRGLAAHLETNRFMPLDDAGGCGFLQQRCRAAACLLDKEDWPDLHGDDVLGSRPSGREWLRLVRCRNWTALAQLAPDSRTLSMADCFSRDHGESQTPDSA